MDQFYNKFSAEFTCMLKDFKPSVTASGELQVVWLSNLSARDGYRVPLFVYRLHPFTGGGGVPLGLQTVGGVLAHRVAQHPALFLLQAFWFHNGEAAPPAVLCTPDALHQN